VLQHMVARDPRARNKVGSRGRAMSKSSSIRYHAFELLNFEGGHQMDEPQYSTLLEALSAVPDPRKARGKQYSWVLLLTLVSSALASGERSGHGIAS
jgi:hypothetical protein